MKKKSWAILGLALLAAGYWCNFIALQSYIGWQSSSILKVLGDVLPFEFSIGDYLLFAGYGIFAVLLGRLAALGISKIIRRKRVNSKEV